MIEENEEQFENSSVDPGFNDQDDKGLTGREDKRETNIDASISIKEMREGKDSDQSQKIPEDKGNDAMNHKNDREHGAF
ncbi:MAG: hypothetical protein EOO20_23255, partial [Chryseobacterium sp.]